MSGLGLQAPYSYYGPRTTPPYWMLHWIDDPDRHDFSYFAENIRWAKEQYNLYKERGWTESPENMAQINEIRVQGPWLSPGFVASLPQPGSDGTFNV